jgi:hypothetical protein
MPVKALVALLVALSVAVPAHAEGRTLLVAIDMVTGVVRGLCNLESEAVCLGAVKIHQPLGSWARGFYKVRTGERLDCRVPK